MARFLPEPPLRAGGMLDRQCNYRNADILVRASPKPARGPASILLAPANLATMPNRKDAARQAKLDRAAGLRAVPVFAGRRVLLDGPACQGAAPACAASGGGRLKGASPWDSTRHTRRREKVARGKRPTGEGRSGWPSGPALGELCFGIHRSVADRAFLVVGKNPARVTYRTSHHWPGAAGASAFPDQFTLEFRDGGEHGHQQAAL
jgi:hypothetical protein